MSIKYNMEEVRNSFESEGYTLISKEYKNVHTKLKSICPNGHEYEVSFTKWLSGRRCLCKYNKRRLDIDYIRQKFEERGYKLLSKTYKHNKKLKYICSEGHEHEIRWDHFNNGHGCPYCAGRPIITIEQVRESFEKEGYTLLTDIYTNCKQKLFYVCPEGHKHSIVFNNWQIGDRCPTCAGNIKKTIGFIKSEVKKEGYKLLTENYINNRQRLHLLCPNGHDYYVTWNNWNRNGSRCTQCKEWGTSIQEASIVEFVSSLCNDINVLIHDRNLISPHELDIVIPEKRLAIEYCGLYWHSELAGKDKNYHLNKLKACEEKGYRLITIFEDELVFNKDIVFSRLFNLLGKCNTTIYARNCVIKEVSSNEAILFCNKNHVQGYGSGSTIKLGAFYGNELVSVMTFSRPSISKGQKTTKYGIWELHRFCSRLNYRIVGVASKLLKYFERNYEWNKIFSYADRRWSDGNVYEKLGFNFVGQTKPNYWYIKNQKRIHRFNLRKTEEDSKNRTEWQIRKSQGWNRVWDCGNMKFDKTNN
jgi:hypothetical protein